MRVCLSVAWLRVRGNDRDYEGLWSEKGVKKKKMKVKVLTTVHASVSFLSFVFF